LTAAVVAVYLGLVLAGATPQLVAQTPQTQAIHRRSSSEKHDPSSNLADTGQANPVASPNADADPGCTSGRQALEVSQTDIFRLAIAFAAADVALTPASTLVTHLDQGTAELRPLLAERIHNAALDAISAERFSRAVPLPRGSLS